MAVHAVAEGGVAGASPHRFCNESAGSCYFRESGHRTIHVFGVLMLDGLVK